MRKNLIKMRKEKGYTQRSISEELGITLRHYKSLEAGTSKGSVGVWEKLRDLLGAKCIDDLLEQVEDLCK